MTILTNMGSVFMIWSILSDSSCDLPVNTFGGENLHFATVPLKIRVGGTEYVDNDELNVNTMLAHMKNYKGPSSSACPAPEEWAREFRKSDFTFVVTMTSALSGTYNSAVVAKNIVMEEYPCKKIHVLDSRTTSGGMALILRKAEELILKGEDFETVVKKTEEYSQGLFLLFCLGSYDNLIKNGRMSKVAGILANTLGIRAIASTTPEGEIKILQKPRGEERAIAQMVELMGKLKDMVGQPVVISHCNNPKGAQRLKDLISHVYLTTKITILQTRGLTSYYTEEGGLLIGF
jgi:DegV family protein with EDD domain